MKLKQPENQHMEGYMKEAQQLIKIKSPKPLCHDSKVMKKPDVLQHHHLQRRGIYRQDSPEVGSGGRN